MLHHERKRQHFVSTQRKILNGKGFFELRDGMRCAKTTWCSEKFGVQWEWSFLQKSYFFCVQNFSCFSAAGFRIRSDIDRKCMFPVKFLWLLFLIRNFYLLYFWRYLVIIFTFYLLTKSYLTFGAVSVHFCA